MVQSIFRDPDYARELSLAVELAALHSEVVLSTSDAKLVALALDRQADFLLAQQEREKPLPLTPDDILAAARQHARYLKTVPPREYEMRVFEDGSVQFRNLNSSRLPRLYSFKAIKRHSRHFWLSPQRKLWQHILAIWK